MKKFRRKEKIGIIFVFLKKASPPDPSPKERGV